MMNAVQEKQKKREHEKKREKQDKKINKLALNNGKEINNLSLQKKMWLNLLQV